MATVQFYLALRVSEVGGLRFEDLRMDFREPEKLSLRIVQRMIQAAYDDAFAKAGLPY